MSYDLFIKRRIDEIEEKLLCYADPIERLYVWFSFVKEFSGETHNLMDRQYTELVQLCSSYVNTPDMVARESIREQVAACSREIANFNEELKRVPKLQSQLEKAVIEG